MTPSPGLGGVEYDYHRKTRLDVDGDRGAGLRYHHVRHAGMPVAGNNLQGDEEEDEN
jgi:hypothetical protein